MWLPADAVAVPMSNNDNPLQYRTVSAAMTIVERTDNEITFAVANEGQHSTAFSIGAILSNDREEVYWINTNRPLP